MGRTLPRVLILLYALSAVALPVAAQITTGTLAGIVVDSQGGVIPGAAVVLISETQGTRLAPVVTGARGNFAVPSLRADTYSVEVSMHGFKKLTRQGVSVSGSDRVVVEPLVLQVGGTQETVTVRADAPLLQSATGERSETVETTQLENLPISTHDFQQALAILSGVNGTSRIGGGGQDNYMIDGVSAMDTGNNGLMGGLNLPVDALAEVKVIKSGASADSGRSSGMQVSAVTKSGSNQFHWSLFQYQRNSDWNSNTWANSQNGNPKAVSQQADFGVTVGGPVGKPGGHNKLFFFYSQELRPRRAGHNVNRFRLPTVLERNGDFSQTLDSNGNLYNLIYDPASGLPKSACSATTKAACFQDGGVVGRIPLGRLYGPGLALLSQYPAPNTAPAAGQFYNYSVTTPIQFTLAYTPVVRLDYDASPHLHMSGKWNGQNALVRPAIGTLPGFSDTLQKFPLSLNTSVTVNYSRKTTFAELTYGVNQNRLGAPPISPQSNRNNVVCPTELAALVADCTLGRMAFLFPDAGVLDPRYYEYGALQEIGAPFFQNGRSQLPPQLNWAASGTASRINGAPPSLNFPGFMNINRTQDLHVSVTRVVGRHSVKVGFYDNHSYKAQNLNSSLNFQGLLNFGNDATNPIDSGFPFANAALGVFSSYAQQSRFVEGSFLYDNVEWFVQDNWKVSRTLTLDYGLRFVHQTPQYDTFNQGTNFFADRWTISNAPFMYLPGCAGAAPCTGDDRQATDPRTGGLLGAGTSSLIGQVIVGTGDLANGMLQAGHGIANTGYVWPWLGIAPRLGAAYEAGGRKRIVLRGSIGLYFDRPDGNTVFNTVANPPVATGLTQQWGSLADLANSRVAFGPVPAVRVYYYDSALPSDIQWNGGFQMALPWRSSIDLSYVGHHAYNVLGGQQSASAVDLNTIDLGTTTAAANQDATQTTGTALPNNLLRPYRGYSNIQIQWGRFHRTFHSLQGSLTRRFNQGLSFGVNWTYSIGDTGNTGLPPPQLRIDHRADGTYAVRADQATAEALFANQGRTMHIVMANFVWDPPDIKVGPRLLHAAARFVNGWQLSGVLRVDSGAPYDATYTYQSGGGTLLTGSPDYTARIVIKGNPGSGCSSNQYRQFNTDAFAGPQPASLGLESGRNILHSCGDHRLDLAIQRSVRLKWLRNWQLQLRADLFNALNTVIYSARNASAQFVSPSDMTLANAQYLTNGEVNSGRLQPDSAGFGAATGALATRTIQAKVSLKF